MPYSQINQRYFINKHISVSIVHIWTFTVLVVWTILKQNHWPNTLNGWENLWDAFLVWKCCSSVLFIQLNMWHNSMPAGNIYFGQTDVFISAECETYITRTNWVYKKFFFRIINMRWLGKVDISYMYCRKSCLF